MSDLNVFSVTLMLVGKIESGHAQGSRETQLRSLQWESGDPGEKNVTS